MSVPLLLFYVFAALAVASALAMVALSRNLVAGALCLVVTMVSLAGIFVLLGAEFLGVVQIMVYAGAIMVLVLFAIMLLDLGEAGGLAASRLRGVTRVGGVLGGAGVAALLVLALIAAPAPDAAGTPAIGHHRALGRALFTDFVVPVEIAGLILLAAIVGAVILAKRRLG